MMTDWTHKTDAELVGACLTGNTFAWHTLIERYSRLIYAIPLRFGYTEMVAEEIFQEVCLILLEKLDTLQDKERIRSWLVTITRRTCIDRLRQRQKIEQDEYQPERHSLDSSIEEDLQKLEQQHLVHLALAGLPERDQELLQALFFEEPRRSYEEIAAELNIPIGSIGPYRARSLQKLRLEILRLEPTF